MKNIFRSDSEIVNTKFAWQQKPKIADKLAELSEVNVETDGNAETKEALKDANMSKDVLEQQIAIPETAVRMKIDEVKGLLDAYMKTDGGSKDKESKILEVLNTIANEEVRAYVAKELGIKLESFETLDEDADFDADEMLDVDAYRSGPTLNSTTTGTGDTTTVTFSEEALVKLYYSADGKDESSYVKSLDAAIGKDINLVKADMEKRESNKEKGGGLFKAKGADLTAAYDRLEALFPEEFGKDDDEKPNFQKMIDAVKGLKSKELYKKKQEFPSDYSGTKEMQDYLGSIPPTMVTGEEEPYTYKADAKEYVKALEAGYRGTFEEWDDAQPRSGLGALIHRISKMFRDMGGLKGMMPEWLRKMFGGDTDEEMADAPTKTQKYLDNEKDMKDKAAALEKADNKESWVDATDVQKEALKNLSTNYNELFSFEVATVEKTNIEGVEDEKVYSSELAVKDLDTFYDKNGEALTLKPEVEKVLNWGKGHLSEGISEEGFSTIMTKLEAGDLEVKKDENGVSTLTMKIQKFESEGGIESLDGEVWGEGLIDKINEKELEITTDQENLNEILGVDRTWKTSELKELWVGDSPEKGKLKPVVSSLLTLGEGFWKEFVPSKENFKDLNTIIKSTSGGGRFEKAGDDNDYYTVDDKGKLIKVYNGYKLNSAKDAFASANKTGEKVNDGKKISGLYRIDLKSEYGGHGGSHWTDFTSAKAFFLWAKKYS